jgi:hypothetical protein
MCHMCRAQTLELGGNQIGVAGVTALANACAGGAMAQLQVIWRATALSPRLEAWHARCMGMPASIDVPYMCPTQELSLWGNQIGDAGVTALANACAGGAMAQLQVDWRLTVLIPCLETWHARSLGLTVLFGVPYVPYAEAFTPH